MHEIPNCGVCKGPADYLQNGRLRITVTLEHPIAFKNIGDLLVCNDCIGANDVLHLDISKIKREDGDDGG